MKVLVFGATGFVGSAVARAFLERGHEVTGVGRSEGNTSVIVKLGMTPVIADYSDRPAMAALAGKHDVTVFAAMIDWAEEQPLFAAIFDALRHSGKTFLYTSGTGVLSIANQLGHWNESTFAEDDLFPFTPTAQSQLRLDTEAMVRAVAADGIRSFVMRPGMIWGHGGSIHIPRIFDSAIRTGAACYMGLGLNLYSNIHVDDLAEAYALAHERGAPGAVYHAVAGEANFRSVAEAVATVVGCDARSVDYEDACAIWSRGWVDLAIAVNSRSLCPRTRSELGWLPTRLDMIEDIRSGSYRDTYQSRTGWAASGYHYAGAHAAD